MSAVKREPSRFRPIGKTRLILLTALSALLVFCFASSWFAPGTQVQQAPLRHRKHTADRHLVSTQPWQTAQTLAASAATYQEAVYARRAEELADHEVDQAFDAALRCAELEMSHHSPTGLPCPAFNAGNQNAAPTDNDADNDADADTARSLAIDRKIARVRQLQQDVARDNRIVTHLKSTSAATTAPASDATGGNSLRFARFQLGIDSDELIDAQRDLNQATGNVTFSIEKEFENYQGSTRKFDNEEANNTPLPLYRVSNPGTLIGRVDIWLRQRKRLAELKRAHQETLDKVATLTAQNKNLQVPVPASTSASPVAHPRDPDQNAIVRLLAIHQDRLRTNQDLADVYTAWIAQLRKQHNFIRQLIFESIEAILAVILWMILSEAILHLLTDHPVFARRKTQTLRAIFRVAIQLTGILIILLFVFGPPHETGTIIGLITAALALALQDYILAFFGWFMISGPNGITVGDMVEIDGVCGEVIEIGLMRTTLLETTGLREKGEPTGRRVSLLNSFAVHGTCFNFSSEGQWLWDEITITVPAGADIYTIAKSVEEVAIKETADSARKAEQDWNQKMPSTSLNRISAAPIVMMRPSISLDASTGIDIQVRYVTHAVGRAEVRDRLYKHVIQMLKQQNHLPPPQQASPAPA